MERSSQESIACTAGGNCRERARVLPSPSRHACANGCTDDPGHPDDPLYVEEVLRLLEQADHHIVNDGGYRQTIRDMVKGWHMRPRH